MISKQQLPDGAVLQYIGKPFEGYTEEQPQMTFLGYDSNGWTNIWVDYQGTKRMVCLTDIEVCS